jgi:hypothetical protein
MMYYEVPSDQLVMVTKGDRVNWGDVLSKSSYASTRVRYSGIVSFIGNGEIIIVDDYSMSVYDNGAVYNIEVGSPVWIFENGIIIGEQRIVTYIDEDVILCSGYVIEQNSIRDIWYYKGIAINHTPVRHMSLTWHQLCAACSIVLGYGYSNWLGNSIALYLGTSTFTLADVVREAVQAKKLEQEFLKRWRYMLDDLL